MAWAAVPGSDDAETHCSLHNELRRGALAALARIPYEAAIIIDCLLDLEVCRDCAGLARDCNAPLVAYMLQCGADENAGRLIQPDLRRYPCSEAGRGEADGPEGAGADAGHAAADDSCRVRGLRDKPALEVPLRSRTWWQAI